MRGLVGLIDYEHFKVSSFQYKVQMIKFSNA
jgi:hypothetical protein